MSACILAAIAGASTRAYGQSGVLVYVPNLDGDSISVFRTEAGGSLTAVTTLTAINGVGSSQPMAAAVRRDQAFAYVTINNDNVVAVIDTSSNTIVQQAAVGDEPFGVAISASGTRVYVANNGISDSVSVFDADLLTGQLTAAGTIATGANSRPRALAFSPDGSHLYVLNQGSSGGGGDSVHVVNTSTDSITATITVGDQPVNLAVSPDGTRVYVANASASTISVIDTATNTVVASPAVSAPLSVAVSPDGRFFYATQNGSNQIRQFDTSNNTQVAAMAFSGDGNSRPGQVTFSPDAAFAYATDTNSVINQVRAFSVDSSTGAFSNVDVDGAGTTPRLAALCGDGNAMLALNQMFVAKSGAALGCAGNTAIMAGGTLRVAGADLVFNTPIVIESPSGAIDTNGNNATIASATSGSASFAKLGAGTLTLSGPTTRTGNTQINGGTLRAGAANVLPSTNFVSVGSGTTLDLNGFDHTVSLIFGNGNVSLGSATLTVNDSLNGSLQGVISGSGGLTKSGPGFLILQAANLYTGPTLVNGGTLVVGTHFLAGSTASGPVTVASGGSLWGAGTVGGAVTVQNGGTITPETNGSTIATLTVGALALNAGATAHFQLNGVTADTFDRIVVNGPAALGGTLSIVPGFTPTPGQSVTILSAASISGTFAAFNTGGTNFRISYGPTTVTLTAAAAPTITAAASGNIQFGDTLTDTATLAGGSNPTGTLTFRLYGPNDATCSSTPVFTNTLAVSGNNSYRSAPFMPTAPGTYRWIASYSGDAINDSTTGACNAAGQAVIVGCAATMTPLTLPPVIAGLPFNATLSLVKSLQPVTWSTVGTLPAGLSFADGVFAGTTTVRGASAYSVTATDASGCQATTSYTLAVSTDRRLHTGSGAGSAATARAFNIASGIVQSQVQPYGSFTGGVAVAQGDTNSDGVQDLITGAGPGATPHVQVVDGRTGQTRLSFFAFDPSLRGGVEVAAGDINGDGFADVIAVAGCSPTAEVRAFHGLTGALLRTYQYTPSVGGCGQHVAAGDINGDGSVDIVVGAGSGGAVGVINGSSGALLRELIPYAPGATTGVFVAAGDVTGDGFADIVTAAGAGASPHVRVFDGLSGTQIGGPLGSFMAYPVGFGGGARVAAGDLNGDGRAEVITGAGPGGGPHLRVWDGATGAETYGLYAFDPSFAGGIFVAGPTPIARMNIDIPAVRIAGTDVRIAGWALREVAANSVGTDAIHVWAFPVGGTAPIFVGAAPNRVPRPDVAAAFGGEFLMSGFDFVGTLASGTYDLYVYVRNSQSFQFDQARVIRITVN